MYLIDLPHLSPADAPDPVTGFEQVVLGSILSRGLDRDSIFTVYPPEAFHGLNLRIAEAMAAMPADHMDPLLLNAEMLRRGVPSGPYIHTLVAAATEHVYGNGYLSELVRIRELELARQAGMRMIQATEQPDADPDTIWADTVRAATTRLPAEQEVKDYTPEIATSTTPPVDWVLPNLLARQERFILTGPEGQGKSTLIRQIALAAAAGRHPFHLVEIPPCRVFFLELENSAKAVDRSLREMGQTLGLDPNQHIPLRVVYRSQGVNVAKPATAASLLKQITNYRPDLVVMTPLYKLHRVDITDESAARTIIDWLDHVRVAANAALLIEAHSPLTTDGTPMRVVRPYGSSIFLRWPEFGRGLRMDREPLSGVRAATLESWRGDREVPRSWPDRIRTAPTEPSARRMLPWVEEDPR